MASTGAFDWHSADLTAETVITQDYRSTQNVRRFFRAQTSGEVRLGRPFIAWIKANAGKKTLGDAFAEYERRAQQG